MKFSLVKFAAASAILLSSFTVLAQDCITFAQQEFFHNENICHTNFEQCFASVSPGPQSRNEHIMCSNNFNLCIDNARLKLTNFMKRCVGESFEFTKSE